MIWDNLASEINWKVGRHVKDASTQSLGHQLSTYQWSAFRETGEITRKGTIQLPIPSEIVSSGIYLINLILSPGLLVDKTVHV